MQLAVRSLLNQQVVLAGLVRGQQDGAERVEETGNHNSKHVGHCRSTIQHHCPCQDTSVCRIKRFWSAALILCSSDIMLCDRLGAMQLLAV